jgi:hypothetical protein
MNVVVSRRQPDLNVFTNHIKVHASQTTDDHYVRFVDVVHREAATREQVIPKPRFRSVRTGQRPQQVERRSADCPIPVARLHERDTADREFDGRMRAKVCRILDLLIQPMKVRRTKNQHTEAQVRGPPNVPGFSCGSRAKRGFRLLQAGVCRLALQSLTGRRKVPSSGSTSRLAGARHRDFTLQPTPHTPRQASPAGRFWERNDDPM